MAFVMNVPEGKAPKRGDLLQSNYGDRRERTWMILSSTRVKNHATRFNVWRARWWELEPDFRIRLYRSAERNGGQVVWYPEIKQFENLRKKASKCA
jgi:hypothetical protein